MKRKASKNQAIKNNFTPKESLPDAEFAAGFNKEDLHRAANRNSKHGKQGR
ncbi:hypothetical protein LRR81_18210 [Metabacillus sp. GX 13764]|uniref:hypothetical protein n=1 Tax=Metabacillus kandeliae TaxID=2900151 RepID=UPI001E51976B|nr:hypothetical protein [Metabacillus kandeliae]MCD7036180.1 hypothetical protein [Metabacillus kandeliae]